MIPSFLASVFGARSFEKVADNYNNDQDRYFSLSLPVFLSMVLRNSGICYGRMEERVNGAI